MTDENAAEAPKRARRMAAEESDAVVSHDDTPQRASRFAAEPDESEAPSTTPEEPIHEHDATPDQHHLGDHEQSPVDDQVSHEDVPAAESAEDQAPEPEAQHEHSPWRRPDPHSTTAAAPSSPAQPIGAGTDPASGGGLAASSTTPPDAPSFAAPGVANASAAASDPTPAAPTPAPDPDQDSAEAETADELRTSRKPRNPWPFRVLASVLVLALAAGAFYLVQRSTRGESQKVQVTHTPSRSASPTAEPAVSDAAMVTDAEAAKVLGSKWEVVSTLPEVNPSDETITCQEAPKNLPNSSATRQRALRSNAGAGTAMLQRLDNYPNETAAKDAYVNRMAELAACDDVAALITTAATVNGLADESYSVTVSFKDGDHTLFHTIVISRTGTVVSMVDVGQATEQVPADKAAQLAADSAARYCGPAKGTCPTTLAVRAAVVPPTPEVGWLAQSDLPRISKGAGIWSTTATANVTSKGSQCENLTLADAPGPTERQQRSYILDQDDAAPEGFGVDQVRFIFANDAGAKAFYDKLVKNIRECGKRTETAKVSDDKPLTITGQNRVPVSGQVFKVTQATGESSEVQFRVAVVISTNKVTYLVSNTKKTFDFTVPEWQMVAARAGQRITQTR